MDNWLLHTVSKAKEFSSFLINFRMGRDVMLKETFEIVTPNWFDIKALSLWVRKLDFERKITLDKGISFRHMMSKGSIWWSSFKFVNLVGVSDKALELKDEHFENSWFVGHFSNSSKNTFLGLLLNSESLGLSVSVAIEHLSILDPHGMYHRVSIKPVCLFTFRNIKWIRSISQVHPIDICWNFSTNYISNFIRLFLVDWSKVSDHDGVLLVLLTGGFYCFHNFWFDDSIYGPK